MPACVGIHAGLLRPVDEIMNRDLIIAPGADRVKASCQARPRMLYPDDRTALL